MSRTGRAVRAALAAATVGALGMLPAGTATAATPATAPPGNSAVNQYTQSFPSANGPRQVSSVQEGRPVPSPRQALGKQAARRLQASGPEGRKLAELAASTAPSRPLAGTGGRAGSGARAPSSEGPSGADAVAGQALGTSSSGKLGVALPLILLATVAWAAVYAWRRRARSSA